MKVQAGTSTALGRVAILLLLSLLFFFVNLGDYSLKEPDEGRYAEIPREMVESGDWVVPYFNYTRYFEKPPFLYWATALSFKLFGLNEWAFRFPNALCALLTVLLVYFAGRRLFSEETGFISAIVLCSSFSFLAMARIVTLDMCFAFLLFLSLCSCALYFRQGGRRYLIVFYLSLACATLTKGPVAVVLVGATVFLYSLTERTARPLLSLLWLPGIALYLVVAAPWFVLIGLREKEFIYFFFVDQHILRFLTTQHKRSGPFYYFIPVLLGGLLPWTVLLPRALQSVWRSRDLRLFLLWSLVTFLFFSLSGSKLPPYILPLFPPLALVLGHYLAELKVHSRQLSRAEILASAVLGGLFAVGALYAAIAADTVLPPKLIGTLQVPQPWWSLLLCGVTGLAWALFPAMVSVRSPSRWVVWCAAFPAIALSFLLANIDIVDKVNTSKRISLQINELRGQFDEVVNLNSFEESVPFYTRSRVILAAHKGELAMGARHEDAAPYFISLEEFLDRYRSEKRILTIAAKKILPALEEKAPGRMHILLCEGDRCLLSNR